MRRYVVFENYDPGKLVGFVEIKEDVPEGLILDCVIAPQIQRTSDGDKIVCYGIFPREQTDTRPRA